MNTALRNTEAGRALYNQLRLQLAFPGETVGEVTKPYVDKWSLTYDELLALPDTPDIAARRNLRPVSFWTLMGRYGAAA